MVKTLSASSSPTTTPYKERVPFHCVIAEPTGGYVNVNDKEEIERLE